MCLQAVIVLELIFIVHNMWGLSSAEKDIDK